MRAAAVQREAGVHLDTTLVVALTFRTVQFMSDDIAGDAADLDRSSRVGSEVVVPRRMLVPAVVRRNDNQPLAVRHGEHYVLSRLTGPGPDGRQHRHLDVAEPRRERRPSGRASVDQVVERLLDAAVEPGHRPGARRPPDHPRKSAGYSASRDTSTKATNRCVKVGAVTAPREVGTQRPGGRSARVRAAVIAATLAELVDRGYSGVSLDSVSTRAAVHKTTVYRRWRTKEALILDAMLEQASQTVAVPDTGSLRGDLLELARRSAQIQTSPAGEAVVRAVAGEASGNPQMAAASRQFWTERLELDRTILQRARDRGEIGAKARHRPVIEALLGPLYFRLLVTGEPLDDGFVESVVQLVYTACTADRPRASRG